MRKKRNIFSFFVSRWCRFCFGFDCCALVRWIDDVCNVHDSTTKKKQRKRTKWRIFRRLESMSIIHTWQTISESANNGVCSLLFISRWNFCLIFSFIVIFFARKRNAKLTQKITIVLHHHRWWIIFTEIKGLEHLIRSRSCYGIKTLRFYFSLIFLLFYMRKVQNRIYWFPMTTKMIYISCLLLWFLHSRRFSSFLCKITKKNDSSISIRIL